MNDRRIEMIRENVDNLNARAMGLLKRFGTRNRVQFRLAVDLVLQATRLEKQIVRLQS